VLCAYALLAPALILILALLAYPLGWMISTSLTDRSVRSLSTSYIGLRNYLQLISDPAFWAAARHTISYIVLTAVLKLAVGVGVAFALFRPFRGRSLVFMAAFLPWAYPGGIALLGWDRFLNPPVHTAYSEWTTHLAVGVDRWLGTGAWGFLSVVVFNVWRGGSFTGIFLLAALNALHQDLFDYAALEARNGWRHFWMVMVPLLRPYLALAAYLSLTSAVVDLGTVWLQTGGRDLYPIVWTLSLHYALLGGQWGQGAALSLILLPLLLAALVGCYRLFEPLEEGPA
jgi:multiple sugar transport system permease protein